MGAVWAEIQAGGLRFRILTTVEGVSNQAGTRPGQGVRDIDLVDGVSVGYRTVSLGRMARAKPRVKATFAEVANRSRGHDLGDERLAEGMHAAIQVRRASGY